MFRANLALTPVHIWALGRGRPLVGFASLDVKQSAVRTWALETVISYHCQPHRQCTVSERWNLRRSALHNAHGLIHIITSRLVARVLVAVRCTYDSPLSSAVSMVQGSLRTTEGESGEHPCCQP